MPIEKKSKKSQHNTPINLKEKYRYEEYYDMKSFKMRPISQKGKEDMALRLRIFADEEDSLKITQFFRQEGVNSTDFYRWCETCVPLKMAHEYALSALGDRREIGGLKKKFDAGIVNYTMAHYDKSWKMLAEWRAKLKSEAEQQQTGPQIVVIEKFPNAHSTDVIKTTETISVSDNSGTRIVDKIETTEIIESDNFKDSE